MEGRSGRVTRDDANNGVVSGNIVMKMPVLDFNTASKGKGNFIYDVTTDSVLVSDGFTWFPIGSVGTLAGDVTGPIGSNLITSIQGIPVDTPLLPNPSDVLTFDGTKWTSAPASGMLPPPLQSIANLITVGNEMIYTVATDTYATTLTSALGRGFLSYSTIGQQQTALGLTIGGTVQAHSLALDFVTATAATSDQMIVSSGGTYTNVNTTTYGRSLLAETNQTTFLNNLDAVTGRSNLINTNRITKVTTPGVITESGISIDASDNISGVNDITFGGTINSVTTTEFSQLANINSTTISSSQWGYLGSMDQPVDTSSTPSFSGATMTGIIDMTNNKIENLTDPTLAQDAATKFYVDLVATTGAPPLTAVKYATAAILPNTPVYNSPAETLTSATNSVLVVDGISPLTVGDRVLVKNQSDNRENGVYTVTNIGGGSPWVLTRATDFNQATMPVIAGTSVFVQIIPGASNSSSTWDLQTTVNTVDPLTDPVVWIQIGGVPTYTAGTGISASSLVGGTIALINPVATSIGGTGTNFSANTGNVVVTNNATMTATKVAPSGDFVGTTDIQNLSNKTFTLSTITDPTNLVRATQLATTGADVVLTAAPPGITGDVLSLSSPTTAVWTTLPPITSPSRTLFVYQGATNVFPNYSTLNAAVTAAIALVPIQSNWVKIEIFPGTYQESTPLYIPPFISITGLTSSQSDVIISPVAPAAVGAILESKGNVRLSGIVLNGSDGAGGFSAIGFNSYYDVSSAGTTDYLTSVTVRNCTLYAFHVNGNTVTPTQYSKILICKNCSAQVTTFPFTMGVGFNCLNGGVLSGIDLNASGFFAAGNNNITYGFKVDNDFSIIDVASIQASYVINGGAVGGSVTSTSRGLYPIFRVNGGNFGMVSTCGIFFNQKSVIRISDFKIQDDTGFFPNQKHAIVINSPAASDPNYVSAMYLGLRTDLLVLSAAGTPTVFVGVDLNETPGKSTNLFLCQVNVGSSATPASFTAGGGTPNQFGMQVYTDNGGVFSNITPNVAFPTPIPISIDCATTAQIDLISAPATIDGISPTSGITTVLVKNGSNALPNSPLGPLGYSIDNGLYIWNGTGNPMTRYAPFGNGTQYTDKTWFVVKTGTINYGSQWKFQGRSGGFNTGNITIGTTSLNFKAFSSPAFVNANGNIIYIGNAAPFQFPQLYITLTSFLTTTSPSFPSKSVVAWEYWNGVSWINLPFMTFREDPPYSNKGNYSFGYGDTITPPTVRISYSMQFGPIRSTWNTVTVNGVLGYWIRARVIDSANITQVPIIGTILLGTSHTEINEDGFVIYYGDARPAVSENVSLRTLNGTGISGEVEPTAVRQICSSSPIISLISPNSYWGPGVVTSSSFTWHIPENIDSSTPIKINICISNDTSTGTENSLWNIDYAFVNPTGGVISINSGTGTYTTLSSSILVPIPATLGTITNFQIPLNIEGLIPLDTTIWFKISRQGTNILDTYTGPVYISSIDLNYVIWAAGKSYTAF
jgi:hypothetical protein